MSRGPFVDFFGDELYLFEPDYRLFTIERIGYALAGINRFAGRTRYTVAQHSLEVSQFIHEAACFQMRGLLHDAPEVVLGDPPAPLEGLLKVRHPITGNDQLYATEFCRLFTAILHGLIGEEFATLHAHIRYLSIRLADRQALLHEARDVLPLAPDYITSHPPNLTAAWQLPQITADAVYTDGPPSAEHMLELEELFPGTRDMRHIHIPPRKLEPLPPEIAEYAFIDRFHDLKSKL